MAFVCFSITILACSSADGMTNRNRFLLLREQEKSKGANERAIVRDFGFARFASIKIMQTTHNTVEMTNTHPTNMAMPVKADAM